MKGRKSVVRVLSLAKRRALPAVAVLCLFLLAFLAVTQAVHFHSDPAAEDHCPLCVSMHSVVPLLAVAATVVLIRVGFSRPIIETRPACVRRFSRLVTRPPPFGR